MLLQTLLGTSSNVSPTLCQISQHLQDALLTKLLGQFIEAHRKSKFSKTRNTHTHTDIYTYIYIYIYIYIYNIYMYI